MFTVTEGFILFNNLIFTTAFSKAFASGSIENSVNHHQVNKKDYQK